VSWTETRMNTKDCVELSNESFAERDDGLVGREWHDGRVQSKELWQW
jgi:hypothetical protein